MPKKLIVPKETFIEQGAFDPNYYVRFRLVTEDQNKFSYWSPIFSVHPEKMFVEGTFSIPGKIIAEKASNYVTLAWDSVGVYKFVDSQYEYLEDLPTYDLWIQFGSNNMVNAGSWIYKDRIFTTSVNIIIPSQYNYFDTNGVAQLDTPRQMKIEVHRPVRPITRHSPNRSIFIQDTSHISIANDTISFDENHHFETGDAVGYYLYNAASAALPLVDGTVYWIRSVDSNTITLHTSQANAINNTGKINFTTAGQGAGVFVKNPFLQSSAINTTTDIITTPFNHGFETGDAAIYNALTAAATDSSTGRPALAKETLVFIRVLSSTTFRLYRTRVEALNNTGHYNFSNTGTGYATLALLPSLLYKTSVAI